jgi:transcriptional regulator with XRE-family HTH domain
MSPVNVPAIGAYIREQREQARISLRQLAQAAGVSNPYLSQIERGLRRPSADILQQIAKGLRISAEALYVQAGILEDHPAGQDVREAVLADPGLTERQKQMLAEIYESFRSETALAAERAAAAGEAAELAAAAELGELGEPGLLDDAGAGLLADRATGLDDDIDVAGAEVAGLDPAALAWPETPGDWPDDEPEPDTATGPHPGLADNG